MSIGQFSVHVVDNRPLSGGYFRLEFAAEVDNPVINAEAGQFVMLRGEWGRDLINGRAFSVMEVFQDGRFSILAKAFGRGTSLMKSAAVGDLYTCTGPLGRPFPMPAAGVRPMLIAGGVGLPPILFYARSLAKARRAAGLPVEDVSVFYGGRSREELVLLDELEATGASLYLASDDGSLGVAGRVTVPVAAALDRARAEGQSVELSACGPTPMLRALRELALAQGVVARLCLEEQMACGFGVCLGCAVPVYGERPYAYCCTDGPVFEAEELRW